MDVLLINCDNTYSLDPVEELVKLANPNIRVDRQYCNVSELQAVSEEVRRRQQLLCGVFVVNAYESRLSINEENAGIGYAVLYNALLEAAKGRVVVVIGGDDRYKEGEQDSSVLSTWAYHKIAAQFDDSYLDGRRGFVFSWDERHNPVHEEALGRYFVAISLKQCGLEEPFKPKVPLKSEKTLATTQSTEFNVPEKQAPTHRMVHDNTGKPGTVDGNSSENQGKCDESVDYGTHDVQDDLVDYGTHDVQDDSVQGASNQFGPTINNPRQTNPVLRYGKSKKPVPEQGACQSKTPTLGIPNLVEGKEENVAMYVKNKIEKETKQRIVKVIEIYVNKILKNRYDYTEGGEFLIPDYFRKHIDGKKEEEKVLVAVIIDDGAQKRPPKEDLGLKILSLDELKKDLPPYFWQGGCTRTTHWYDDIRPIRFICKRLSDDGL
ncbi:PREDICTED: uncharacterized protein LOC109478883 [Branchiostoma belcheri]|uniref:Uncharacterized protein LOC109478883 n=1 Tax=Branchiostoma belcheri TaxID=7741 RepID=A0A6P4Z418_BRABE|nr:PREDICTED: uncharacterized protein LOC109478883 [Branchiostoma belcheri]